MSKTAKATRSGRAVRRRASESPFGRFVLDRFDSLAAFAANVGVGITTVYRARHGQCPGDLQLRAIANGLGLTEADCARLIRKSGGAA